MATAVELKALGNKAFVAKDYQTAIKHFSDAIELDPTNHVLFSNRSACFASLRQLEQVFFFLCFCLFACLFVYLSLLFD